MSAPSALHIRTHAKVNLFLRIVGRRPDGYHEIETILHGIGLADDIEVIPTSTGRVEIEVEVGDELVGNVPTGEENIMARAAAALVDKGSRNDGVRIRLEKRIPVGAGLGGGSGNAAGALVVLNELWESNMDRVALVELAAAVGSDVPYCIGGGTALATGRGDKLTALPSPGEMWFVLGISNEPLATAEVYEGWDSFGSGTDQGSAALTLALGSGDVDDVASLLHNDLEQVAFKVRPDLEARKASLVHAGAVGSCLSGSGPTLFGIARDQAHARSIAAAVRPSFDRVVVVRSQAECIEFLD